MPTRVLAITSEVPWPLDTGGHLRSYHLLAALSRAGFDVAAIAPVAAHDASADEALRGAGIRLQQVVVGARTLTGEARRAAGAMFTGEPYVFYRRHYWKPVREAVARARASAVSDVLYLDHLDSHTYAAQPAERVVALDMHNVYSTLVSRTAADAGAPWRRALLNLEAARVRTAERRAVAAADVTFAVSDADADAFRGFGARRVVTVPNGVDAAAWAALPAGRPISPTPVLLFVGALSWPPNQDACICLAREVLPRVRARFAQAEVHLVGRAPTAAMRELAEVPGVRVFADVPDVGPHLATASALVVPLTVGGGTRLKILEAFAAGLPVVSTPVGAEGIACRHAEHLLVAERPAMADAIVELLSAPDLGRDLAARGRRLATTTYDWSIVGRTAADALVGLVAARLSAAAR